MKRVMILIGDWPDNFAKKLGFFGKLEKEVGCKVIRKSEFRYETEINGYQVNFQFCFGPLDDKIWRERRQIRAKQERKLPPSIEHIAKSRINADTIYYLGFCAVLRGKINTFYLPNRFKEVLFDKYIITEDSKDNFRLRQSVKIKNSLLGIISGKECSCLTSNQVLSLNYVEGGSPDILYGLAKELVSYADILEMENYEVASRFGRKYPIGILLYGTDSPLRKVHMLGAKKDSWEQIDVKKFVKGGIELVKEITK